jgi:hypothetical protein
MISALRTTTWLLLTLLIAAPVLLAVALIETRPLVPDRPPADAAAAARAQSLIANLGRFADEGLERGPWVMREDEMNGALTSAARVLPGLRGTVSVGPGETALVLSLPVPMLPAGYWLNLQAGLAESGEGLAVSSVRLGRLSLPPALVLPAMRIGLDRLLGDGLGRVALASVAEVRIAPPEVALRFDLPDADRAALGARVRELLHAGTGGGDRVYVHLWYLDHAVSQGELPRDGSVLPYLRHAVTQARRQSKGADPAAHRAEMQAALSALMLYCGQDRLAQLMGMGFPANMRGAANGCDGTRLGGRDDLKRHFTVSAGLYATGTGTATLGIGELKELVDSNEGGSGFSFDDMAANLAGIRFAQAFLEAPRDDWPALMDRIESEADVMPAFADLPSGLSEAAFRDRFGDVDSPAYAAVIAEIGARIEALPLHRAVALN